MKLITVFRRSLHHEGFLIFFSLAGFLIFPWLSRRLDATAAPVDPGVLSLVLTALLAFLIFKSVTWWVIRIIWPVFAEYSELHFERNFKSLVPLQKVLVYLGFYLALLMGFVWTLGALM